jgi:uncharacterized membrane protein
MASVPQELLIITWPVMNRAEKVLAELQQLQAAHAVHLKYAEVLTRDTQGRLTEAVKVAPVTKGEGAIAGAVAGGVLGLLVQHFLHRDQKGKGIVEEATDLTTTVGAAVGAGAGMLAVGAFEQIVPANIVQSVEHQLTDKSSALIAVVHIDHLPQVLDALKAYPDGTILQSTLDKAVVEQLAASEKHS